MPCSRARAAALALAAQHAPRAAGAVLDGGGRRSLFHLSVPSNNLTLSGLVLRNAAALCCADKLQGGVALLTEGSLRVEGCEIANSIAAGGGGGALAVLPGAKLDLFNSRLVNNSADHGGAIFIDATAVVTVSNCTFQTNRGADLPCVGGALTCCQACHDVSLRGSDYAGGAVHSLGTASFADCLFTANRADKGGALAVFASHTTLTDCTLEQNVAEDVGGALAAEETGSFTIRSNTFRDNLAGGHGSAVEYNPTGYTEWPLFALNSFDGNVGLSTVRYTNFVTNECEPGKFAPNIASITGDYDGCPLSCNPGTFQPPTGTSANPGNSCIDCAAGEFQQGTGKTECVACDVGHFCTQGASAPTPCVAGTWTNMMNLAQAADCADAPPGSYTSAGADEPTQCSPGTFAPSAQSSACTHCEPGSYMPSSGATACQNCSSGHYCDERSVAPLPCPAGRFTDASLVVMTSELDCIDCSAGSFCPTGSGQPAACNPGTVAATNGSSSCAGCAAGTYQDEHAATGCKACMAGTYCNEGASSPTPCAPGTWGAATNLTAATECQACPLGHYCTTGSAAPHACSTGWFAAEEGRSECSACFAHFIGVEGRAHLTTRPDTIAISALDCVCGESYFDSSGVAGLRHCELCLPSTNCVEVGLTVATLPVTADYWRASEESLVIRTCTTVKGGRCIGSDSSAPLEMCEEGHEGPYCSVCFDEWYTTNAGSCTECGTCVRASGLVLGAIAAGAIFVLLCAFMLRRKIALIVHGPDAFAAAEQRTSVQTVNVLALASKNRRERETRGTRRIVRSVSKQGTMTGLAGRLQFFWQRRGSAPGKFPGRWDASSGSLVGGSSSVRRPAASATEDARSPPPSPPPSPPDWVAEAHSSPSGAADAAPAAAGAHAATHVSLAVALAVGLTFGAAVGIALGFALGIGTSYGLTVGMGIGLSIGIVFGAVLGVWMHRTPDLPARIKDVSARLRELLTCHQQSMSTKSKIVISSYQVLALVGVHFGIVWPNSYSETTNRFDMIVNVNPLTHTCLLECLGLNWYARFLGATLTPTVLAGALLLSARVLDYRSARRREADRRGGRLSRAPVNETAERLRWASQMVIFLFFVAVTSITFRAFDCDIIDADVDPRSFLRADYSISCESSVDARRPLWLAYAALMLLLWPIGVSSFVVYKFWQSRLGVQLLMEAQLRYDACVSNFALAKVAAPARTSSPSLHFSTPQLPPASVTPTPTARAPLRRPVGSPPRRTRTLPRKRRPRQRAEHTSPDPHPHPSTRLSSSGVRRDATHGARVGSRAPNTRDRPERQL